MPVAITLVTLPLLASIDVGRPPREDSSVLFRSVPAVTVRALIAPSTPAQTTELVSLDSQGAQSPSSIEDYAAVSYSGRFVSFASTPGLTHGVSYGFAIYRRDWEAGTTVLVSVPLAGTALDGASWHSAISDDGRYVAFESLASTLVPGDSNAARDYFVRDLLTATTARVSVASNGSPATGDLPPSGSSTVPTLAISGDGRYVAFESSATNLVELDTNGVADIFVHDRLTGVTERVSRGLGAEPDDVSGKPRISRDGRFVAFESRATNLVPDRTVPGFDIFVYDRIHGSTTLASRGSNGAAARRESRSPSISGDGRWVAFQTAAAGLDPTYAGTAWTKVYVRDLVLGTTTIVSRPMAGFAPTGHALNPSISADGSWVAFEDFSSTLVPADTNGMRDIFRWSRATGVVERLNLGPAGVQANEASKYPSISGNGELVAYHSWASNLIPLDISGAGDVYASR